MDPAKALKRALASRGITAFLCEVPPGMDIGRSVIHALTHCDLAIILGTPTYGAMTESGFSTYEELRHIMNENKPFFLVKMCSRFQEAETRFRLPAEISYYPWQPVGESRQHAPSMLVDAIVERLAEVQGHGSARTPAPRPSGPIPDTQHVWTHSAADSTLPSVQDMCLLETSSWNGTGMEHAGALLLEDAQPASNTVARRPVRTAMLLGGLAVICGIVALVCIDGFAQHALRP